MATLILEENGAGETIYKVQFYFRGKPFKRSLGKTTKFKAEQIEQRVENRLKECKAGYLQAPSEDSNIAEYFIYGRTVKDSPGRDGEPSVTFETVKATYLDYERVRLAETHFKTKTIHLGHLEKFLGQRAKKAIAGIHLADLQAYVVQRSTKVKPVTVRKELKTFTHFFGSAVKLGHIEDNPVDGLELPKEGGSLVRFRTLNEIRKEIGRGGYTKEQTDEMFAARYLTGKEVSDLLLLCNENDVWFYPILATYIFTGIRRSEGVRLQWQHVEFDRRIICAGSRKQSRTKEIAGRDIDIHDKLFKVLHALHKDGKGASVFTDGKGNQVKADYLSRRLKTLVSGTDFEGIGFNAFRHSFASNLAAAGVDQRIIDLFMGHQTEEMRKRYQHLFPENKTQAIHELPY